MGVMEARRRILLNQPHLVDASGNPIAFQTDMAAKMGVKAHFSPVQSGSGDPSPSNVRPISGWTWCTVSHSGADTSNPTTYPVAFPGVGKNLFDVDSLKSGTVDGSGRYVTNDSRRITPYIFLKTGTYVISRTLQTDWWKAWLYNLSDKNPSRRVFDSSGLSYSFTLSEDCYIRIAFDYIPTSADEIQLESGSDATSYEPFTNTIYGGHVDYEKGEVVAEWAKLVVSASNTIVRNSTSSAAHYPYFMHTSLSGFKTGADAKRICDSLTNVTVAAYNAGETGFYRVSNSQENVYWQTPDCDTSEHAEALRSSGYEFVYELATPIHYPITPQIIKSLKGANTIWSDTNGNVSLKYWKH